MTIVNIALRVPSASGVDVPAVGTLDFKPVARRTVGDTIVLPRPFRVSLVSGNATVSLAATGADWFWQVTENTQQRYQRSVAVPLLPNPVGYEDLVDVDPKTFAPDTSLVPGWVAAVPIAVDEWLTENPPPAGPPNTLTIGTVTEGATPAASITGASPNQTLDLTLKTGAPGAPGPPNSLTIGTVQDGAVPAASITGTPPNQVLDLTLKTGDAGPPNTLTIGTVTEGATAAASITGTAPNQVLDLTLKTGDAGPPNTLAIGSVTQIPSGGSPTASVTGAAPNQTLNLGLVDGGVGPANTLTVGTVSRVPSGGTPTASVTGTAPNQTLNLGLVDGSPTAFELRGEGFPGTGLNATATNAASPGTYYTDVLGTNGAWRWLKTSAGTGNARWVVALGDTRRRNVDSLLAADWEPTAAAGGCWLQRTTGDLVTLDFRLRVKTGASIIGLNAISTTPVVTMPTGFTVAGVYQYGSVGEAPSGPAMLATITNAADIRIRASASHVWAAGSTITGQWTFRTSPTWPTTLPGSAV